MQPQRNRIVFALASALSLALGLSACARKQEPPPTVHQVEYTVRAEITDLPGPGEPAPELQAHHEPIPSFVEKFGDAPAGMRAMTMPFPLAPGLDLSGVQVGDKVALTFKVDYSIETGTVETWRVTAIRRLPPETALEFGAPAKAAE